MIKSTSNSEHYTWGTNCDGWHLLKSDSLSVIQEKMPPGTREQLHFHSLSQQFFYILSGTANLIIEDVSHHLNKGESIHILPGIRHFIQNEGTEDLHFLVVSEPKSHGDRTNLT